MLTNVDLDFTIQEKTETNFAVPIQFENDEEVSILVNSLIKVCRSATLASVLENPETEAIKRTYALARQLLPYLTLSEMKELREQFPNNVPIPELDPENV